MKELTLTLLGLLFFIQSSYAGASFNENNEFEKRTVLIVLYQPEQEMPDSLIENGQEADLKSYNEGLERYNENVQFAFDTYWAKKPHKYVDMSVFLEMSRDSLEAYSVLTAGVFTGGGLGFSKFVIYSSYSDDGEAKLAKKYFQVDLQDSSYPTKSGLLYLIAKMKVYYGYEKQFNRKNLETLLATKTLLVSNSMTKMEADKISKAYPFPSEVKSFEEIEEIAAARDPGYVYIRAGVYNSMFCFMIVDCETGKVLSRSTFVSTIRVSWNELSERSKTNMSYRQAVSSNSPTYNYYGNGMIGEEIMKVYESRLKFKKIDLEHLSSQSKQFGIYPELMIY